LCYPERLKKFSELVEDVFRTTIDTGPRGAIRFAQGVEAFVTVGGEWAVEQLRVCTYQNLICFSVDESGFFSCLSIRFS
jgi:hypothetical protein